MPKESTNATFRPPWLDQARWPSARAARAKSGADSASPSESEPASRTRAIIEAIAARFPALLVWHSRWKTSLWSSLAVHVGLIALLAFIMMRTADSLAVPVAAVESRWNDVLDDTQIERLKTESSAAVTLETIDIGGQSTVNPLASLSPASGDEPAIDIFDASNLLSADVWSRSPVLENPSDEVGLAGEASLNGSGSGSGIGDGDDGFFGIGDIGNKQVFVVDASKSMNHPHDSEAKTRFGRLKIELVNTIGRMNEETEFFVIFFNDQAIPMPAPGLIPATRANQMKSLQWVASAHTGGKTDPRQALLMALQLEPDVIYFLTDGEFEYRVVKDVTAANKRKTPIYTFCFSDRSGEKYLKQIAAQNAGKYHYVP